jgi:hypothetical protein
MSSYNQPKIKSNIFNVDYFKSNGNLKHNDLLDKNGNSKFQHITQEEKDKIKYYAGPYTDGILSSYDYNKFNKISINNDLTLVNQKIDNK